MSAASNEKLFSWMNPKLEVRELGNGQGGVFTKEDIAKDERLAIFGGYILTLEEEANLPEVYRDTGVQIAENFVLTSMKKEDADYLNHSCEPNAGFDGQIFLVALNEIKSGTEIRFDYAMALYTEDPSSMYTLECTCGTGSCRKIITSNDWMKPELQEKYRDYFQPFLKRKII